MRKTAILLAAAIAATSSTAALAKKRPASKPDPAIKARADTRAFFYAMLHQGHWGDGLVHKGRHKAKRG